MFVATLVENHLHLGNGCILQFIPRLLHQIVLILRANKVVTLMVIDSPWMPLWLVSWYVSITFRTVFLVPSTLLTGAGGALTWADCGASSPPVLSGEGRERLWLQPTQRQDKARTVRAPGGARLGCRDCWHQARGQNSGGRAETINYNKLYKLCLHVYRLESWTVLRWKLGMGTEKGKQLPQY